MQDGRLRVDGGGEWAGCGGKGGRWGGGMRASAVWCGSPSIRAKSTPLARIRGGDLDGREKRPSKKKKKNAAQTMLWRPPPPSRTP